MLAIFYLLLSWWIGYQIIRQFLPQLFITPTCSSYTKSLFGKPIPLDRWMVVIPGAFLVGTVSVTWLVYLLSYAFAWTGKPMLYGNLTGLLLMTGLGLFLLFRRKEDYLRLLKELSNVKLTLRRIGDFYYHQNLEVLLVIAVAVVWGILMFESFRIENGQYRVGLSVISDFGAIVPLIRSFSHGANFPTEYPVFTDGTIRYHFLFHFLAGNLEFLGLPIDWALNLPSILAFTAMMMLLYSFSVSVLGQRWIGLLTAIFFFFRSSFAFFDFVAIRGSIWQALLCIPTNADHIGRTACEDWGLWAQKTFVNQRHFPFSLGVMLFILIVMLPLLKQMVRALRDKKLFGSSWLKEFAFKENAWFPERQGRAILIGILLGAISFWNGAVVVATLPMLFIIALFSKRRLEFGYIAVITLLLTFLQSAFFMGMGKETVEISFVSGFLAERKDIVGILSYYVELLGIMPFVVLAGLLFLPKGSRVLALAFLMPLVLATSVQLTPQMAVSHKFVMVSTMLLNMFAAGLVYQFFTGVLHLPVWKRPAPSPVPVPEIEPETAATMSLNVAVENVDMTGSPEASAPAVISDTIETPLVSETGEDSAVCETAPVADNKAEEPKPVKKTKVTIPITKPLTLPFGFRALTQVMAILILVLMTITGVVDLVTLGNMDRTKYGFNTQDPLTTWLEKNTGPNEIFLTDSYLLNNFLFSGRKIFYGYAYFAWSAGYDTNSRELLVHQIYGGTDPQRVKELLRVNKINYVVIDDGNRSKSYPLNEQLFKDNFPVVYQDQSGRLTIYKVPN